MGSFEDRRAEFRKLHENGCFVIPNPWDVGSARFLRKLGFQALATTSSGFAFSQGQPDSSSTVTLDSVLTHFSEIVGAVDLPVNADFQAGHSHDFDELADNVQRCISTGVAGFSIEDATGHPDKPLYELAEAIDRIKLVREVIDRSGQNVMLTARAECFLVGHSDPLEEAIRRLQAYAEAGADVLFAPSPGDREIIRSVVQSVHPKPVNVIMSAHSGLNVSDIAELGARRISVGSALARAAWTGFIKAATQIAETGSFEGLAGLTSFSELNTFFEADSITRK